MLRKVIFALAASAAMICLLPAQTPSKSGTASSVKPSLDKAKLETYLRHLFVWPPPIQLTISDPVAGALPGYYEVKVRGSQGEASQEEVFFVSPDGQKIVRGQVFDLTQNPFKKDLDQLKTEGQPSFGTPGAPVVITEFSDFECPYCRQEAQTLRQNLLATYPKDVRLYYFDFPLETLHPWAKAGAIAGRCVFKQNAADFWEFHDWIFANQGEITPENLKPKVLEFGKGKGLNVEQLGSCMDTKATEAEVDRTKALGKALEVDQTPSMFVNGRRMVGTVAWPDLKRVIDYEIEYQKTAKNAGEDCGCDVKLPSAGGAAAGSGLSGLPKK